MFQDVIKRLIPSVYSVILTCLLFSFVDDTGLQGGGGLGFSPGSRKPMLGGSDEDEYDSALGLGELAGLTVTNEADPSNYDVSASCKEGHLHTTVHEYIRACQAVLGVMFVQGLEMLSQKRLPECFSVNNY